MTDAENEDSAKVKRLEEELATARAEMDAASINFEQASQAMENRYASLSREYEKAVQLKEEANRSLGEASEEVAALKTENNKLKSKVVEKDALLEEQSVKVAELHSDIQRLLRLSEQKDAQISEQQQQLSSYSAKVQSITDERVDLTSRLAAAERAAAQSASAKDRLQHEKANLEKHNKWLLEELERKSQDMIAGSRASSEQLAEARSELQSAKFRISQLESSEKALKERVQKLTDQFDTVEQRHSEDVKELESHVLQLQQELETSKQLAELRREAADAAKNRVTELEGIINEMMEQTSATMAAKDTALAKEEEVRKAIEEEHRQLQERLQNIMSAAHSGQPIQREIDFGHATPGSVTPGSRVPPAPSSASLSPNLSLAELYGKYEQKDNDCRQERAERRRLEKVMDEMVRQVEIRASVMKEQKAEHDRMMESYQTLQDSLASADSAREALQKENRELMRQLDQLEKDRRRTEQMLKDCSAQVQHLLWENQELSEGDGKGNMPQLEASAEQSHDAGGVITQRLVPFSGVRELQERNMQLLALTRDLAQQLEEKEKQAKEELDSELLKRSQSLQTQLDELINSRQRQQELVGQIIRQRDLYKDMLSRLQASVAAKQDGDSQTAQTPSAREISAALAAPRPDVGASDGGPDWKALHTDVTAELEKVRSESSENIKMLQAEKAELHEELSRLRAEAKQAVSSAAFERERYERLTATNESNRKELEEMMSRNMELTLLLRERERKLREVEAELDEARSGERRERARAATLQAENDVISAAEARVTAEVTELTKEKTRLAASLEAHEKFAQHQLEEFQKERDRLTSEIQRITSEWSDAQKALSAEKISSSSATRALDEEKKAAAEYRSKKESELAELQAGKSAAEQRAAVAEGKIDVLSSSLKKAEERASYLAGSRPGQHEAEAEGTAISAGSAQPQASVATEMVMLRQELAAAQEAAAAASGHAAQYKAIAASSDDALKAMQQSHEAYKADSEKAAAAAAAKNEELQERIREVEAVAQKAREAEKAAEAKLSDLEGAVERETAPLKEKLAEVEAALASSKERATALERDVDQHYKSWRTSQQMYEQELMHHAEKVKELNTAEKEKDGLQKLLDEGEQRQSELSAELAKMKERAESAERAEKAAVAKADARCKELSEQLDRLHRQLEKVAEEQQQGQDGSSPGQAGGMGEVIKYLRREKETAECQLALTQQEAERWKQQAARAERSAAQASKQLEESFAQSRTDVQAEADHKELMDKVQQLNLLRESNDMLRTECEKHLSNCRNAKAEVEEANKKLEDASKRLRDLEAEAQAKESELKLSKEEAKRWEARSQQLLEKMKTVDPREHQRVCDELKTVKEKLAAVEKSSEEAKKALEEELSKTKASLTKSMNQERIAKKQITMVFNPNKLPLEEWKKQRDQKDNRITSLEAELKVAKSGAEREGASAEAKAQNQAQVSSLTNERNKLKDEVASLKEQATKSDEAFKEKQKELDLATKRAEAAKAKLDKAMTALRKSTEYKKRIEEQMKQKDDLISRLQDSSGDGDRAASREQPPETSAQVSAGQQPAPVADSVPQGMHPAEDAAQRPQSAGAAAKTEEAAVAAQVPMDEPPASSGEKRHRGEGEAEVEDTPGGAKPSEGTGAPAASAGAGKATTDGVTAGDEPEAQALPPAKRIRSSPSDREPVEQTPSKEQAAPTGEAPGADSMDTGDAGEVMRQPEEPVAKAADGTAQEDAPADGQGHAATAVQGEAGEGTEAPEADALITDTPSAPQSDAAPADTAEEKHAGGANAETSEDASGKQQHQSAAPSQGIRTKIQWPGAGVSKQASSGKQGEAHASSAPGSVPGQGAETPSGKSQGSSGANIMARAAIAAATAAAGSVPSATVKQGQQVEGSSTREAGGAETGLVAAPRGGRASGRGDPAVSRRGSSSRRGRGRRGQQQGRGAPPGGS